MSPTLGFVLCIMFHWVCLSFGSLMSESFSAIQSPLCNIALFQFRILSLYCHNAQKLQCSYGNGTFKSKLLQQCNIVFKEYKAITQFKWIYLYLYRYKCRWIPVMAIALQCEKCSSCLTKKKHEHSVILFAYRDLNTLYTQNIENEPIISFYGDSSLLELAH